MLRLALVVAFASLVSAATGAAGPTAALVLRGTATLKSFDAAKDCKWETSRKALQVGCTVYGSYAGLPAPAGAGYGWVWNHRANAIGVTTRYGSEQGTLLLDFGARGVLELTTSGKQRPVGRQTSAHAKVSTTGTWKLTKATANFAGDHGTGTYTYTVERDGSTTVFQLAGVTLAGSIRRS